jgi:sensor domain CHASE-containing protein
MRMSKNTFILSGATFLGLIIMLYASSQVILGGSFAELEEQRTRQDVERFLDTLSGELSMMDSVASDWAAWDDTYAFIEDANEEYIQSNLGDETFTGLKLNLMVFIHSSGRIVFEKAFDLETEKETPVPDGLKEHLSTNDLLLHHPDPESSTTGIVLLPEGPMLIASRPIITSENEGPVRGTLIMGRYLDAREIDRLGRITHLSILMHRIDAPQIPPDFQEALASLSEETPILVIPSMEGYVEGYARLKDVYGLPEGPILITMEPTIDSDDKSLIRKTSLRWRYLDSREIDRLDEISHLSPGVYRVDDLKVPPEFKVALSYSLLDEEPIFVKPLSEQTVGGYTILKDIYGKPVLMLRADLPRDISMQGQASIRYFFLVSLALAMGFGLGALFMLEKKGLLRISRSS